MDMDLKNYAPRKRPQGRILDGRYVTLVPYSAAAHGEALWQAFGGTHTNAHLYHFGWPELKNADDLCAQLDPVNANGDYVTFVFERKTDAKPVGMASYMRIDPANGVIEVGCVGHGLEISGSPIGTEAHYLLAKHIFEDLGYRRYEWKLNNPNEPSHRAARRFGFTFEGVFRQHMVRTYGNRDTAWYSMLDCEWPRIRQAFENWLEPSNFDAEGRQRAKLEDIRASL